MFNIFYTWKITYLDYNGNLRTQIYQGMFSNMEYEILQDSINGFNSVLKIEKVIVEGDTIETS